jgi:hypothetical protein
MANTTFPKPAHSNGPRIGLFDVPGTSTDTTGGNFVGGPYGEYVHQVPDDGNGNSLILIEGWDTGALLPRKIKVDSSGQIFIANAGTTSLGAIQIQVEGTNGSSTNVGFGTADLLMPVSGSFTLTPTGTQTIKSDGGNFIVTQGTATNLNATVVGTVTSVPSGTQTVTGTVAATGTIAVTQVTSPWVVGGTVTATPTGTQVVSGTVTTVGGTGGGEVTSGTASNFLATVFGTVTTVPSGTQNVKVIGDVTSGTASNFLVTATPTGTQAISGTVAATQSTSPWVVSGTVVPNGTVTIIPSGTQTIAGTVTANGTVTITPSGTQTITGTVTPNLELDRIVTTTMTATSNIATISCQGAGAIGMNITGTWTGTMSFQASVDGSNWLAVSPPAIHPAGSGVSTTTANGQWSFLAAGNNSFRINPTTFSSGTATVVLEANQASRDVIVVQSVASMLNATVVGTVTNVPSGTQTVSGTVTSLLSGTAAVTQVTSPWVVSGTVVPNGTVTIVPSGTQTVAGTVTSVLSGTAAVTQATSPWVVSQGTASNLRGLSNIGSTFNTGQITVGTATGTTILASNTSRIRIVLINTGTNAAYIGTATTVASTSGQLLAGIVGYPMSMRSTSAICGIAAASTVTITYLEEVI